MNTFTTLAIFEFSTEANLVKSKLESEGITCILLDERTVDSDPLISQAIGGVKLQVLSTDIDKAATIYNKIRKYETDANGNEIFCKKCNSTHILVAPMQSKTIFYRLFPFFEKARYICNDCKNVFKK